MADLPLHGNALLSYLEMGVGGWQEKCLLRNHTNSREVSSENTLCVCVTGTLLSLFTKHWGFKWQLARKALLPKVLILEGKCCSIFPGWSSRPG